MLTIKSIPAFNDNYIWLIQNSGNGVAVVDPGDAEPVIEYLKQHDLTLEAILITHHHSDHTGGLSSLVATYPSVKVAGPAVSNIPHVTIELSDGDQFSLFGVTFDVLSLPGHTLDHIGFLGDGKLFCGDVLFSAGCGRVFEGTMNQMFDSLQKISALPDSTELYPAHEYTTANVVFALAVEPNNRDLLNYRDDVQQLRAKSLSTLPTTLEHEKRINPFIRTTEDDVICSVANRTQNSAPSAIFTALREWKNDF